ncbi:hypothetical protein [Vitiosangium sp. GDMCC 1.1324]|uniref:hypothetical protein n=1 Tax=Vitiosangium sp. (strain GDMCC 1.1324) TaxID=2138576 RepID=UPI000D3A648A|nr:hypothetical protein [Vitiosangium sp. GDMCC 1.1324]PTL85012.1 hypothetical protein DAT35_08205 [Vitiosangium sp. GDMCC 1.1324]
MTDAKRGKDGRLGPFRIGRRLRREDPEMGDLGRLYEARNVHTDAPALVLLPGPSVDGDTEEDCRVRVTVETRPLYVALQMEKAPATGRLVVLAGMLKVLTRMVERMEWSDEARGHLMQQPQGRLKRWAAGARRALGLGVEYRLELSVLAMVLYLVVAHWRAYTELERGARHEAAAMAVRAVEATRAPTMVDTGDMGPAAIAYPLPDKPFSDQAKAPCKPNLDEVELNGGCWLELAKRPPCGENYAEYQGKCYVPVSARSRKPREPQALHP